MVLRILMANFASMKRKQYRDWQRKFNDDKWVQAQCVKLVLEMAGVKSDKLERLQKVLKGDFTITASNGDAFTSIELEKELIEVVAKRRKQVKKLEKNVCKAIEGELYDKYKDELRRIETAYKAHKRSDTNMKPIAQSSIWRLYIRIVFHLLRDDMKMEGATPTAFEEQFCNKGKTISSESLSESKNENEYTKVKNRCLPCDKGLKKETGNLNDVAKKLKEDLKTLILKTRAEVDSLKQ